MLPDFGNYGVYIWPAYAATGLILVVLAGWILRRNARVRAELSALETMREAPNTKPAVPETVSEEA
ncbi:MAG: heme exporter protein CcmD [Pseudomonadota bacterium]